MIRTVYFSTALLLALSGFGPVRFGGAGERAYTGPCDLVSCTEAWSIDRAMTTSYDGPLFQLVLASNHTLTLDVGQTSGRAADMTTWSGFCGEWRRTVWLVRSMPNSTPGATT